MFTGIIRDVGSVRGVERRGGDVRLTIETGELDLTGFAEGESIAVAGVCLTALEIERKRFAADVSNETLKLTTLGEIEADARVNLEPSLAVGERMGGHIVTGHIDGLARVVDRHDDARSIRFRFELAPGLARFVARKGSIAIDGVSLTVNAVDGERFEVNLIPHTAAVTTLGERQSGDRVNVEVDLMARYLERLNDEHSAEPAARQESLAS